MTEMIFEARDEHNKKRERKFMRRKFLKKELAVCMMAVMCLYGCGGKDTAAAKPAEAGSVAATDAPVEEESSAAEKDSKIADFRAHFAEVKVNGNVITFPCSHQEVLDFGFVLEDDENDLVGAGINHFPSFSWKDDEYASFSLEYRFKGTGSSKAVKDCDAVGILWSAGAVGSVDVEFYGGICAESTREEVAAILNEVYSTEANAEYSLFLDGKENQGIDVIFAGDKLSEVELFNIADYVE